MLYYKALHGNLDNVLPGKSLKMGLFLLIDWSRKEIGLKEDQIRPQSFPNFPLKDISINKYVHI